MKDIMEYTPGNSILHQMNPITKVILSFCICIACFSAKSLWFLFGIILLDIMIGCIGGIAGKTVTLLKGLIKACLFLFVLQLLFVRSGNVIFLFATDEGIQAASRMVLRLTGAALPLALILSVTKISDLSNALVSVLHMPYQYAFTLSTSVRFVPVFINEMNGIIEAQTARGVEFDTKNILKKMKLVLPLCVPLLITSVKKADTSAMAVELRGFHLRTRDSTYHTYPFLGVDKAILLFSILLVTAAVL